MIRTYSELISLNSFEDRFRYLKLNGEVGKDTFGFDRYLNQLFYSSAEWRQMRDRVIIRDCGCNLAMPGNEIFGRVIIHHMNPLSPDDFIANSKQLLDPEYLITVDHTTHNAIHYGDESILDLGIVERAPNDTCPWRLLEN